MAWRKLFHDRLRALLYSDAVHREIDEEMRFHIEMRTEENVRRGMSPDEARRDAERRVGRLTRIKELGYEVRGGGMLETLWQDLRYAVRTLRKNPGFTLVAVLTLSLGIGANTAIFSVVNAVVLQPLPFPKPEQIVIIRDDLTGRQIEDVGMSVDELKDLQERPGVFQQVSAVWPVDANLTGSERPQRIELLAVSPNYFTLLGANAQLGRVLGAEDQAQGFAEGVVISDGM